MLFMAELSEALHAPSEFRLLNGADPIIVGMGDDRGESLKFLKEVMEDSPAGPTPLCTQLNAVVESILSIADVLKANSQKVTVMIATDGESSDGNVADALRPLTNVRPNGLIFLMDYGHLFNFCCACWRQVLVTALYIVDLHFCSATDAP